MGRMTTSRTLPWSAAEGGGKVALAHTPDRRSQSGTTAGTSELERHVGRDGPTVDAPARDRRQQRLVVCHRVLRVASVPEPA